MLRFQRIRPFLKFYYVNFLLTSTIIHTLEYSFIQPLYEIFNFRGEYLFNVYNIDKLLSC